MAYSYLLRRLLSLVAGILAVSTFGPILGFNVYFNQLKEEFGLSGISVTTISSLMLLSSNCGFLSAYINTRFGHIYSLWISVVLTVGSYLLLWSCSFYIEFYHANPWLLVVYFVLVGQGSVFTSLTSSAINMKNWPKSQSGRAFAALQVPTQLAPVLVSVLFYNVFHEDHTDDNTEHYDLQGFFLCMCCMFGVFTILPVIFTREYPYTENELETLALVTPQQQDTPQPGRLTKLNSITSGIKSWEIQLVFWANCITPVAGLVVMTNITSMLNSLGFNHLSFAYTTTGPLVVLAVRSMASFISDKCLHKIYRVEITTMVSLLALISLFPCIFYGDYLPVLTAAYFTSFSASQTCFSLLPLTLTEYFQPVLFDYIYAISFVFPAIINAIIQPITGYMYDQHVSKSDIECYGFHCYQSIFVLVFSLHLLGTIPHILFSIHKRK